MFRRSYSVSIAISIACAPAHAEAPAAGPIDAKIRSEVAAEIVGINAQDPAKATAYEADDMMFSGMWAVRYIRQRKLSARAVDDIQKGTGLASQLD